MNVHEMSRWSREFQSCLRDIFQRIPDYILYISIILIFDVEILTEHMIDMERLWKAWCEIFDYENMQNFLSIPVTFEFWSEYCIRWFHGEQVEEDGPSTFSAGQTRFTRRTLRRLILNHHDSKREKYTKNIDWWPVCLVAKDIRTNLRLRNRCLETKKTWQEPGPKAARLRLTYVQDIASASWWCLGF